MRSPIFGLAMSLAVPANAAEITSVYTDLVADRDCTVVSTAAEGEGDWADMVCPGYKGYPVILHVNDLRESLFYGFPPEDDANAPWESFSAFNSTGPKIEWRVETEGGRGIPFATIHRWFVSDPEDETSKIEVLVVEKVGQIDDRKGCAIGMVVATGNDGANDMARRIADEQARFFACGADEPTLVSGDVPLPAFDRGN